MRLLVFILTLYFFQIAYCEAQDSLQVDDSLQKKSFFDNCKVGAGMGVQYLIGEVSLYKFRPEKNEYKRSLRSGVSLFVQKDLWHGLGARIEYSNGGLKGLLIDTVSFKKRNTLYFLAEFQAISASITLNELFFLQPSPYRRLNFNLTVGGGILAYRSVSWWKKKGVLNEYHGYTLNQDTAIATGDVLYPLNKDKCILTGVIPIGLDIGYRLNYKTDLFFRLKSLHTFTDGLDGVSENTISNDKIVYVGGALVYNLNRDREKNAIKKRPRRNWLNFLRFKFNKPKF